MGTHPIFESDFDCLTVKNDNKKFGMSFFKNTSSISTRELAEKCEKQEAQLKKTQTRLANVVAAYKTLQEEKKTLEEILAVSAPVPSEEKKEEIEKSEEEKEDRSENSEENEKEEDSEKNENKTENKEDSTEARLAKLTASLATMSAERAKMQNTFQNDRKKMKQDFDLETTKLKSERDEYLKSRDQSES